MGLYNLKDSGKHISHYGTPRHSGRYPWGSGEKPQRNKDWVTYVAALRAQGMSNTDIARGMGMKTTEFRARNSIARSETRRDDVREALKLKDKGMSNIAIGKQMGYNESYIRNLLNPTLQERADRSEKTANFLKREFDKDIYLDIGTGVEANLGISRQVLDVAVARLKQEGYQTFPLHVEQMGNLGNYTTIKALVPPGVTYKDFYANRTKIQMPGFYSDNFGDDLIQLREPKQISSKRVLIRYGDQGGELKDGVIELRRNVPDLDLGDRHYAQVRIGLDGTHFLKGMAVYSDKIPDGVDIVFNTNKKSGTPPDKVFKTIEDDPELPFKSIVRQATYIDKNGKEQLSALNRVGYKDDSGEEGAWGQWAKTLSSQMLSKQMPVLAKRQLELAAAEKQDDFDEIMRNTNPAVKRKLLESFADECDAASVHLKGAALPRQRTHVILPVNSLKDDEVFAPNYKNGEKVVLIRHPHGGIFEIPELTVNNKNLEGQRLLGTKAGYKQSAEDGIGINAKVAEQLSGADFDGDTVIVIPNPKGVNIRTCAPLQQLKDFRPKEQYAAYEGMPKVTERQMQQQMGNISNLITDMTIKGADFDEIARAVKHSMVVIDSKKHNLDYKQSAVDNGIADLKRQYQGGANRGASTLISKADSEYNVPKRKLRSYADGGPIDPKTGKKVYTETGEFYVNKAGKTVYLTSPSKKGYEFTPEELSSGTTIEKVYVSYANRMRDLGNQARKATLAIKNTPISASAKKAYAKEVDSLNKKLIAAEQNAPRERRAQLLAEYQVRAKRDANPDMTKEELKKVRNKALASSRVRTSAVRREVYIEDKEWEAIQAGAVSQSKLSRILDRANQDRVKELSMPRPQSIMSSSKIARAKAMLASGYTQAEVAEQLGVSTSTILNAIKA